MTDLNALPTFDQIHPEDLDSTALARFVELVDTGIVAFDADPTTIMQEQADRLQTLFGLEVTKPQGTLSVLDHRAFALTRAVRSLIGAQVPAAATEAGTVRIDNLNFYLVSKRAEFLAQQADTEDNDPLWAGIFDELFAITAQQVEWLTGVSVAQLAAMRSTGTGPKFFKLSGARKAIRYPAVALLEWITRVSVSR